MPEAFIPPTRAADPADLAAYQFTTDVCEKALRTLLARIGPWGENLVLVGGLAPRYLIPLRMKEWSPT